MVPVASGAVALAAMSWGLVGPAMRTLPDGTAPIGVAAVRMLVGALGFTVLSGRAPLQWGAVVRRGPRAWLLAAVVASALTQWTFLLGMAWAGVAIGAVLHMGLCPVFAALLERATGTRGLTRHWFAVTAVAVLGCTALVADGASDPGSPHGGPAAVAAAPHLWAGVAAAVFSSFVYALFTVACSRIIEAGNPAPAVMSLVFAGTAVGLSPVLVLTPVDWVLTGHGAVVAVFIGLVATTGAYHLFGFGLRHLPPSAVATLVLAEPATAAVVAVAVLGERIGVLGAAGLTTVGLALAAAVRGPRPAPEPVRCAEPFPWEAEPEARPARVPSGRALSGQDPSGREPLPWVGRLPRAGSGPRHGARPRPRPRSRPATAPRPRAVRLSAHQAELLARLLATAHRHDLRPAVEDVAAFLGATARVAVRSGDGESLDDLWARIEVWAADLHPAGAVD